MQKLLLLSVLAALIAIPALAARDRYERRGFRRTMLFFTVFCVGYSVALRLLYFRLS